FFALSGLVACQREQRQVLGETTVVKQRDNFAPGITKFGQRSASARPEVGHDLAQCSSVLAARKADTKPPELALNQADRVGVLSLGSLVQLAHSSSPRRMARQDELHLAGSRQRSFTDHAIEPLSFPIEHVLPTFCIGHEISETRIPRTTGG